MATYLHQIFENFIIKVSLIEQIYNVEKFLHKNRDRIAFQTTKEFKFSINNTCVSAFYYLLLSGAK